MRELRQPDEPNPVAEMTRFATLGDMTAVRATAAIVPAEDAWCRTPGWQSAEADADVREGRTRAFDSMDDLFAEIDTMRETGLSGGDVPVHDLPRR
jgi:hypothetical protein